MVKKARNSIVNKNLFFELKKYSIIFGFILALFIIYFIFQNNILTNKQVEFRLANEFDMVHQRLLDLFFEINNFPGNAGADILFLSKLSSLNNFIEEKSDLNKNFVLNDFFSFLYENEYYLGIEYFHDDKKVIVHNLIYNLSEIGVESCIEIGGWFDSLNKGEVYVSKLSAYCDKNKTPILKYVTPVFYGSERKGFLITIVNANYFLEDIRNFGREGEIVFLIDSGGHYLAHTNRSKENNFENGFDCDFLIDYPDFSKEVFSSFDKKKYESEDYIFSFKYIYPTMKSFEIYKGSEKIWGENSEKENYWVLVSVLSKNKFGDKNE